MDRLCSCRLTVLVPALLVAACGGYAEAPVVVVSDAGLPAPSPLAQDDASTDAGTLVDGGSRPWRYVFVSSTERDAAFAGREGADVLCTGLAAAGRPELRGRTWVSFLSTTNASATRRIGDGKGRVALEYRLVSGAVVLPAGFVFDPDRFAVPVTPVYLDEQGADVGTARVWTGTDGYGLAAAAPCVDWTSAAANQTGTLGIANDTAKWLLGSAPMACNTLARVYCFEAP